jgi:FixJ family two-component response regulator
MLTAVAPRVFVVDDSLSVRKSLSRLLALAGYTVEAFPSARAFLTREPPEGPCCLVLDVIACDLGVGLKTIKAHRARVMEKMRAASVAELVRLADAVGVIVPSARKPSTSIR